MQNMTWRVELVCAPAAARHCKKCGRKTNFVCSDAFRINAQQKTLDVWLLYRCEQCSTTWNHTLFTRVSPQSLGGGILEKLHGNDPALAMQYAMDTALLRKNGAEPGEAVYRVVGDMPDAPGPATLRICSAYDLQVRVAVLLREKLGLSRRELDAWLQSGKIRGEAGQNLRNCKLHREIVLLLE